MDPLMTDLKALIDERNERFEDAGLLPRRNPRRRFHLPTSPIL